MVLKGGWKRYFALCKPTLNKAVYYAAIRCTVPGRVGELGISEQGASGCACFENVGGVGEEGGCVTLSELQLDIAVTRAAIRCSPWVDRGSPGKAGESVCASSEKEV